MFENPKLGCLRTGGGCYCSPASIRSCGCTRCCPFGEDRPRCCETAAPASPALLPSPPSEPRAGVLATLEKRELWEKFRGVGTEMIVTKRGRMFPEFSVSLSGLDPIALYVLTVEALPTDSFRYKWRTGGEGWQQNGKAEALLPARLYLHPESPAPGVHWMGRPVSFSKLKVTNNLLDQSGHLILCSMHKYHLRLCIVLASERRSCAISTAFSASTFPETAFIAVTSYQNEKLSQLKIEENPFAKGIKDFRKQKRREKMLKNDLERSGIKNKEERPHAVKRLKYSPESPTAGGKETPDPGRENGGLETDKADRVVTEGAPTAHGSPGIAPRACPVPSSPDAPSLCTLSPSLLHPSVDHSQAYPATGLNLTHLGNITTNFPPSSRRGRLSPFCAAPPLAGKLDSAFTPCSSLEAPWYPPLGSWVPFLGPHSLSLTPVLLPRAHQWHNGPHC
ncbi:T-box-containing protein TBX6L-like isoform X2 [Rhinatrema bivittatum]|uniref:T-box-containing protein TBX6L-like isoform X2 n=1 Tax=Rhinatrema bivittatum TaxID=194408 RepID=UPI00112EC30D|nr:T-box-containing protein TBX6L-like isoform X2 [Rhinatrema bivittatum]